MAGSNANLTRQTGIFWQEGTPGRIEKILRRLQNRLRDIIPVALADPSFPIGEQRPSLFSATPRKQARFAPSGVSNISPKRKWHASERPRRLHTIPAPFNLFEREIETRRSTFRSRRSLHLAYLRRPSARIVERAPCAPMSVCQRRTSEGPQIRSFRPTFCRILNGVQRLIAFPLARKTMGKGA